MERTRNSKVNHIVTLTLSLHSRAIGSVRRLTERGDLVKFNENIFKELWRDTD